MTESLNPPAAAAEKLCVVLAYGLFLAGFAGGLPLLAGAALAFRRRRGAAGTIYESHYRNLAIVFWTVLLFWTALAGLGLGLMLTGLFETAMEGVWRLIELPPLYVPAWAWAAPVLALACVMITAWYFVRLVSGLARALAEKVF